MGWWTRLIAEGNESHEEHMLRQEVERLQSFERSPRVLTALGRLYEWLEEPGTAIEVYRQGLKLTNDLGGPRWRALQLEERIAICEGRPASQPTLEIEQEGGTTSLCGAVCVLGRGSRGTELIVPAGTVAHEHCAIWYEGGGWRVCDLGSTNGTTLNGTELVGTMSLKTGDELSLAERIVKVTILGSP